jgi:hypothetical protein
MVDISQIAAAIAVSGALIYAAIEYRRKNTAEELDRSHEFLRDIHGLRASRIENSDKYDKNPDADNEWYKRYFNTWELFSYMINKKLRGKELKVFFKKEALTTYNRIFKKRYTKEQIKNDSEFYPEFQRLCKDLEKLIDTLCLV